MDERRALSSLDRDPVPRSESCLRLGVEEGLERRFLALMRENAADLGLFVPFESPESTLIAGVSELMIFEIVLRVLEKGELDLKDLMLWVGLFLPLSKTGLNSIALSDEALDTDILRKEVEEREGL